jgi:hypothetical protein
LCGCALFSMVLLPYTGRHLSCHGDSLQCPGGGAFNLCHVQVDLSMHLQTFTMPWRLLPCHGLLLYPGRLLSWSVISDTFTKSSETFSLPTKTVVIVHIQGNQYHVHGDVYQIQVDFHRVQCKLYHV